MVEIVQVIYGNMRMFHVTQVWAMKTERNHVKTDGAVDNDFDIVAIQPMTILLKTRDVLLRQQRSHL